MAQKQVTITESLSNLLSLESIRKIKSGVKRIKIGLSDTKTTRRKLDKTSGTIQVDSSHLLKEIDQILQTKTIERTRYYIQRLIKSLNEVKTTKINDINLRRWKEYGDILTDSLWLLEKRDNSGSHNAKYWGNFIPQIPNQLIRRFTKPNEWVLDTFMGSGTTLIESRRLGRNAIGIELQKEVCDLAQKNIRKEHISAECNTRTEMISADSTKLNFRKELKRIGIESVQLVIMHPPYWDIIKFSEYMGDLSNSKSVEGFLKKFGKVVDNTYPLLDTGRYLALVIGDKYASSEWIPLGFYTM
jgi:hypothetical protein